MSSLSLRNIKKSFVQQEVIHGVDLDVDEGEFVVFVGPSGCGKSTILRMISGLESTTSGKILIAGRDVAHTHPSKREIAMVFQSYALFPHMNVANNIGFGLRLTKMAKSDIDDRVAEVADILQITSLLDRFPRQLSGGQRQRVAIGRAIIRKPQVFLFDEPLSNLDAALRVQMRLEIARLHKRLNATIIYVTHDQTEAMTLADRIVVFNRGEIEQIGKPIDLYENPGNQFVAGFIGAPSMNFIPSSIRNGQLILNGMTLQADKLQNLSGSIILGVRPEHLEVAGEDKANFTAKVELVEELGTESLAYVQTEFSKTPITIRFAPEQKIRVGDQILVAIGKDKLHVFNEEGQAI